MRNEAIIDFLRTMPRFSESTDGKQCTVECPFCGDSSKSDHGHLSIKIDPDDGEPMYYKCFRAVCGKSGILTPKLIEDWGCMDLDTLSSLSAYNKSISIRGGNSFQAKRKRNYQLVNLNTQNNRVKLQYINERLGVKLTTNDLRNLKIQLSLFEFLQVNDIKRLAFNQNFCQLLDLYTVSFVSMYSDYLICRDITKDHKLDRRYTMYRASGKPDPTDMKLYCIPTDVDLLDPRPACINIAEGTFSILGAYLNTDKGRESPNSIWLANCGSEYKKTVLHVVKQFGLLDINLHIWSDSEIGMKKYEKLLEDLKGHVNIKRMDVHYNLKAEDFGHAAADIKVNTIRII